MQVVLNISFLMRVIRNRSFCRHVALDRSFCRHAALNRSICRLVDALQQNKNLNHKVTSLEAVNVELRAHVSSWREEAKQAKESEQKLREDLVRSKGEVDRERKTSAGAERLMRAEMDRDKVLAEERCKALQWVFCAPLQAMHGHH